MTDNSRRPATDAPDMDPDKAEAIAQIAALFAFIPDEGIDLQQLETLRPDQAALIAQLRQRLDGYCQSQGLAPLGDQVPKAFLSAHAEGLVESLLDMLAASIPKAETEAPDFLKGIRLDFSSILDPDD